jgi:hypothetical protein
MTACWTRARLIVVVNAFFIPPVLVQVYGNWDDTLWAATLVGASVTPPPTTPASSASCVGAPELAPAASFASLVRVAPRVGPGLHPPKALPAQLPVPLPVFRCVWTCVRACVYNPRLCECWFLQFPSLAAGATVSLPASTRVLLDVQPPALSKITIPAGSTLVLKDMPLNLKVKSILNLGTLIGGSEACPLRNKMTVTFQGRRSGVDDPTIGDASVPATSPFGEIEDAVVAATLFFVAGCRPFRGGVCVCLMPVAGGGGVA